jgi:ribosomal protein L37AE/L43A
LGASDQPTESPLDEAIEILNQCVGVIILGYPHIIVESGKLENKSIGPNAPLILATEWNHIEAGIAYYKKLPLLVIHHTGVSGGIFDRGTFNKFLYEVDMSNNSWPSDGLIIGALTAWRKRLATSQLLDNKLSAMDNELEFDQRSGTLISKKNRQTRYCHKCYKSSPSKLVELQESPNGWSCSLCEKFYSNPNYNPPPESPYDYDPLDLRRL